jgi:hypothetical protein
VVKRVAEEAVVKALIDKEAADKRTADETIVKEAAEEAAVKAAADKEAIDKRTADETTVKEAIKETAADKEVTDKRTADEAVVKEAVVGVCGDSLAPGQVASSVIGTNRAVAPPRRPNDPTGAFGNLGLSRFFSCRRYHCCRGGCRGDSRVGY